MKNVGCKFAVNQTVENALDVFLMDIAALNAHFEPPVQKKTQGIKKLSVAEEKRKELNHLIRACALRALGLLLADGAPTVGRGKTF